MRLAIPSDETRPELHDFLLREEESPDALAPVREAYQELKSSLFASAEVPGWPWHINIQLTNGEPRASNGHYALCPGLVEAALLAEWDRAKAGQVLKQLPHFMPANQSFLPLTDIWPIEYDGNLITQKPAINLKLWHLASLAADGAQIREAYQELGLVFFQKDRPVDFWLHPLLRTSDPDANINITDQLLGVFCLQTFDPGAAEERFQTLSTRHRLQEQGLSAEIGLKTIAPNQPPRWYDGGPDPMNTGDWEETYPTQAQLLGVLIRQKFAADEAWRDYQWLKTHADSPFFDPHHHWWRAREETNRWGPPPYYPEDQLLALLIKARFAKLGFTDQPAPRRDSADLPAVLKI